ncbi:MAG TPA: glycosyl hydrolase [Chthonomonadaceae bacterium]|nr:glycosyl hydrolase [Chthonomonadaceae bacterium]
MKVRAQAFGAVAALLLLALSALPSGARPHRAQAILYITRRPTAAEVAHRQTHAKYEPATGCYLGAYIDYDPILRHRFRDQDRITHQDPIPFEKLVGKPHAMYFFYLGYGRPLPMDWVRWLASQDKFVHIALEPNNGLSRVKDDAYLRRLADDMARSGARIFLRFASEMNGFWTNYHNDPAEYRRKFRLVHDIMRRRAPNVAMVWCPYMIPTRGIPAYYPGDDAVDWVGVNLYSVTYHDNKLSEHCENEHPCDLLSYVYDRYSARKPIMVCEYGVTHYSTCDGRSRPDFALRKILTLYAALPRLFPRVKCINYFDGDALRFAADRATNDYCITDDPVVAATYRYAIASPYFLSAPLPEPTADAPALRNVSYPAPGAQRPTSNLRNALPIPMPMREGERLRGQVRLSCFARTPSDIVTIVYKVDGYRIYSAKTPDLWECVWNAGSVRPGRHTLTLEALRPDGRLAASQTLHVLTSR